MTVSPLRALLLALGLTGFAPSLLAQPANAKPPLDSRSGPTPTAAVAEEAAARARRLPGDHIAVVVNAEVVTAGEIAGRVERARLEAQRAGQTLDADAVRKAAQEALIEERVLVTHAREAGARVEEPELDRVVANVAAQNRMTVPQLLDRLKQEGTDVKRFRENLRDQMLIERVRDNEVTRRIRVTDGEIDKLLEERRAAAAASAPINLAQILIPAPESLSVEQRNSRRAEAEAALKRVLAGEDFTAVARELSQDGNRANGGEIGMRPLDKLPELFQLAVTGLAQGQVRPAVVESSVGFHVIKVLERQPPPDGSKITETRARLILVRPNEQLPAQLIAQRLAEAKRSIEAGRVKFEDVASQISEDGTREQGGDLGWAAPGNFVPEFEETMNALAINGISEPFQSRFGVHIVQVLERREVTVDPRQLRDQARGVIRERKFDEAYKEWISDLRAKAFIEVRDAPLQ
jgi:peptidyl-prolyl cis-trans isomerase SurA